MKKEHILIIRFSALGDVAMAVPVVYSLAMKYPNVRITVLSRNFARSLFEDLAPNVSFMGADLMKEYHGVGGLNALYRRLTAKNFTAIADFHNVLRSDYLRLRFNIDRYRVAHIVKDRAGRRRLTATRNKRREQQESPFKKYADVLARLGYPVELCFKSLFPEGGGNLNLLPAIVGPKKNFEQWIGMAPFAAHKGKVYPPRLMHQVVEGLFKKYPNCRVFLFGRGKEEEATFDEWCAADCRCVSVSRHIETMHQELILMSHLDIMVSMDSANMHLASLVGTRVVSIWGATHPLAGFMGWGQTTDDAVQLDLPCRPCSIFGNKPCLRGDYACLRNISPEQVLERIEKVIK
ncbi:MAG: glycosyltransferase family 9 protein [Prevotella sp.]